MLRSQSGGANARYRSTGTYGSDRNGLVWAYRFARDQPARPIATGEIVSQLAEDTSNDAFLWCISRSRTVASERFMREHLSLPDIFYEMMKEGAGSTGLEQDESRLIAQLHDVLFAARLDDSSASSVSVCLEPRLIVTARRRPLRSIDRLRASVKGGPPFRTSTDQLGQLLREQADVLAQVVRDVSARVDAIEDQLLSERVTASRRELGQLLRTLVRLERLLAPEPAASRWRSPRMVSRSSSPCWRSRPGSSYGCSRGAAATDDPPRNSVSRASPPSTIDVSALAIERGDEPARCVARSTMRSRRTVGS